ncbi:MAG: HAD-IIB family hydrolase [Alphaproteobacteria bacterium]|nr:HAD-IIB family hydrolase [Alphaproteobacteria bacterium]
MQPFEQFPSHRLAEIRWVLTDVDDTLTTGPRLPAATYEAIERLHDAGYRVIPVTAAPAGWCDLMCRMWPVAAVIGENGGLCFRYNRAAALTERRYWAPDAERSRDGARLAQLAEKIRRGVAGCEVSADQRWRETTLAFRNPGPPTCDLIVAHLAQAGARTAVNSMWVLGWFAGFDKLVMTRRMMRELFALDIEHDRGAFVFVGDGMNDEPMFGFFPNAVGVAGVRNYVDRMATPPHWVTRGGGGRGFVEIADALLQKRHLAQAPRP